MVLDNRERAHIEDVATRLGAGQSVVNEVEKRLLHFVRMRGGVREITLESGLERFWMTQWTHGRRDRLASAAWVLDDQRLWSLPMWQPLSRQSRCGESQPERSQLEDRTGLVRTGYGAGSNADERECPNETVLRYSRINRALVD